MKITFHLPPHGGYSPPEEGDIELSPGDPYDTVIHRDTDKNPIITDEIIIDSVGPGDNPSSIEIIDPSKIWVDSPQVFERHTYIPKETEIEKGSKGIYYYSDDAEGNRTWYVAEQSPTGATLLYYANEWGNANHSFGPAGVLVMNENGNASIHPMDDDTEYFSPESYISNFWNELDKDEGLINEIDQSSESESDFDYDDRSSEEIIDDFWSDLDEDEGYISDDY